MANNYDVSNLTAIIEFLGSLGKTTKSALADDGKVSLTELIMYFPALMKLPGVIRAFPNVTKELTDEITAEEIKQLQDVLVASECLPEQSKAAVTDGIKLAADLKNYIYKYFITKSA